MLHTNLRSYFPIVKTRDEIRSIILSDNKLKREFDSWSKASQEEFLDFTSGARGVKILYDSFFKEIMNPEYHPERLDDLLSEVLGIKVKIVQVLPTDSTRIGDETSLVTMDIVVEAEDGSLINVEVQKIGYKFPGERSACYSADLLLRQYKRLKEASGKKKFNYKNMKSVYTIVFFENSPEQFKEYQDKYIHRFQQRSDSGVEISLLQKYIFITLDIFKKMSKNIDTKLDAWLTFLGSDKIEDILKLIEAYPEFKPMYESLYEMCLNIEGVMDMFSKELYEMDKNTELLMIDELNKEISDKREELSRYEEAISRYEEEVSRYEEEVIQIREFISEKDKSLAEKDALISQLKEQLSKK